MPVIATVGPDPAKPVIQPRLAPQEDMQPDRRRALARSFNLSRNTSSLRTIS